MSTKQIIADKLHAAFSPSFLNVIDESDKHKGHGGWREGGETHFRVQIASAAFEGMNRVARHRAINDLLAQELESGVHALALEIRSDSEPDPRAARVAG
ncbi:BolA family transcriptional regulator [Roseibium porphyridii]|uniref:BolA family transcriptional regulator n=1 Tax=Roseibium porphyridii TaxID=2866279 RepID=A0ABY8F4K4_9HYPH|nr:BolA family protein [Roseibium sp. KMA01]WFE90416.1 BolA family transcriptional regulator [Roseibium sp. KMA01]